MATRTSLMEFQIPKIVHEEIDENRGVFQIEPLDREDVTDILLNFKNLIARLHGDSPEIEVRLSKRGAGAVTAKDIEAPAELEILNPDLEIANLSGASRTTSRPPASASAPTTTS